MSDKKMDKAMQLNIIRLVWLFIGLAVIITLSTLAIIYDTWYILCISIPLLAIFIGFFIIPACKENILIRRVRELRLLIYNDGIIKLPDLAEMMQLSNELTKKAIEYGVRRGYIGQDYKTAMKLKIKTKIIE